MIELEQKIKNLKKEKKELEQKINIVESQKTSINNEHGRLVKYYKEYKDLQKYIGPEEYKKYRESKEEEEAYEEMKEYIDEIIKKHGFDKQFMEELIKKYDNNEEIKIYLEELIKKYDDAGKIESNFNEYGIDINGLDKDGYNINGVYRYGVDKDGFNINNVEGTRKKYPNKNFNWICEGDFHHDQYGFAENGFNRDGYDIY